MNVFVRITKLIFITLFLTSCGGAKFDTEDPPPVFKFLSLSQVDDSFTFYSKYYIANSFDIQTEINQALLPVGISALNNEPANLDSEPLFFQRTLVGIKIEGPNSFQYFESPLLRDDEGEYTPVALNVPSTALYQFIKNSLPESDFLDLNLTRENWIDALKIFEEQCLECFELTLGENIDRILNSTELKSELLDSLNLTVESSRLSFIATSVTEWPVIFLDSSPRINFDIVEVEEGSEVEFSAYAFQPANLNTIIEPESWRHDLNGSPEDLLNPRLTYDFVYNFNVNIQYNISFDFSESLVLPNDTVDFNLIVRNRNRPPVIAAGAQNPQSYSRIQRFEETISLINDFEDLDDFDQISSCVFSGFSDPDLIFSEEGCSFTITTRLGPGPKSFSVRALDTFGAQSDPIQVNLNIEGNAFPSFQFAYISDSPTSTAPGTTYSDGQTVSVDEGQVYFIHVVTTDPDSDLTMIDINNFNNNLLSPRQQRHGHETNGVRMTGIVSPLNPDRSLDTDNNGTPFQVGTQTITVFEFKPSYYRVAPEDGASRDYLVDFRTLTSKLASDNSIALDIPASSRDSFRLNIRINNIDDWPTINRSRVNPPTLTEGVPFTFTFPENTAVDSNRNPSSPIQYLGRHRNSTCNTWLSYHRATRTFSGTPPFDSTGRCDFYIRAYDNSASIFGEDSYPYLPYGGNLGLMTFNANFSFTVRNQNRSPQLNNTSTYIISQTLNEDETFEFPFSLYSNDPGFNGGQSFFHDPDRTNTFIDPRESFNVICEIKTAAETNYSSCDSRGIINSFSTVDGSTSSFRPNFATLGPEDTEDFEMRIGFKDLDSPGYIYKNVHFTVINTPAPIQITVDDSSIVVQEGQTVSTNVNIRRFSNFPVDTYDFKMTLADNNPISTTSSFEEENNVKEVFFAGISSQLSVRQIYFKPGFTDGDGLDGSNQRAYGYTLTAEQINCTSNCIDDQNSNAFNYFVTHVNQSPTTVQVGTADTSTDNNVFEYTVNFSALTEFSPIDLLLRTIDPDPQDLDSEDDFSYETIGLFGNAVRLNLTNNSIRINPGLCATGSSTLVKSFKVRSQDPASPPGEVERDVIVRITGVNQPSSTCN